MYPKDVEVPLAMTAKDLMLLNSSAPGGEAAHTDEEDVPARGTRSFRESNSVKRRGKILRVYQVGILWLIQ